MALGTELNRENALPKAMRSKVVVVMAAGVEDPLGDLPPLGAPNTNIGIILQQWVSVVSVYENSASACFMTFRHKAEPHTFWLAVRKAGFQQLASVMLFWLAHPVGTCGLERDFSGLTMVTQSTRRRRMKFESFRLTVLTHCYKGDLAEKLRALVRGV